MAEARQTIDRAKRIALYHRIQELAHQDVPVVWVYYQAEILAMNTRVRDYPDLGIRDALPWIAQVSAQ